MGVRLSAITRTDSPIQALTNRNFRLLWLGQGTSWLGDQFRWIALPWLVLQLTHDPLALGAVLALGGLPEAALALIGGAIADRFPPRTIMLLSDSVRLVVLALLAVLTFTGMIDLWMLYVSSFLLGAVSGLFSPASAAMIPLVVEQDGLRAANSVSQGTSQLMGLIGPALAGSTIAVLGSASTRGIALAFGFDALTFLVSVATLWFVVAPRVVRAVGDAHLFASIIAGLHYAWSDPILRLLFTIIIANNLLIGGTLVVGIPVLADSRLPEGAAALGFVAAALAGGTLLGVILSGSLRPFAPFSAVGAFAVASFGVGLCAMAFVSDTWLACLIMAAVGVAGGYVNVIVLTFLQRRTPPPLLGRMMSVLFFSTIGLAPISKALAGAVVRLSLNALFGGAGILLILLTAWLVAQPSFRSIDSSIEESRAL